MSRHRRHHLLEPSAFARHVAISALVAAGLVSVSLFIGVAGYHWLAGQGWVDSLLNASMILAGMGPVAVLTTDAAKIFASAYAIYSGVALLSIVAVLLTPLYHRFLVRFHLEMYGEDDKAAGPGGG